MLDVRIGDRGPRVVLLQVLLNRKGAGLKVDGIFGHHTQKAVMGSRMRLFNSPGPIADPDLWMSLFDEQKLCAVDAFDTGDAHFESGATIVRSAGSHVVRTGAMCNGVPEVVKGIVNQTKPPASLAVLRTWGHGNRGRWLSFTVGEVVETSERDPVLGKAIAAENKSYVNPKNFHEMAPVLAPVGDCFDSIGIYEHHGCSLGSVTRDLRNDAEAGRAMGCADHGRLRVAVHPLQCPHRATLSAQDRHLLSRRQRARMDKTRACRRAREKLSTAICDVAALLRSLFGPALV